MNINEDNIYEEPDDIIKFGFDLTCKVMDGHKIVLVVIPENSVKAAMEDTKHGVQARMMVCSNVEPDIARLMMHEACRKMNETPVKLP